MKDQEFYAAILEKTIPASSFDHKAHLHFAFIAIKKMGVDLAKTVICNAIKEFAGFVGFPGKYDEPLTQASIEILSDFMEKSEDRDFDSFLSQFPALLVDFKGLIKEKLAL